MSIPAGLVDPFYCGCESTPAQRGLLSVDEALRRALALVETVTDIERLPLEKASSLCAAQPPEQFMRPIGAGWFCRKLFGNSAMA